MNQTILKQCTAEFIGTFALILVGIGAIFSSTLAPGDGLVGVALAQGLTIAVMVSATGAISAGHLNPAVTFGLLVGGQINFRRSVAYWIGPMLGGAGAGANYGRFLIREDK